MLCTQTRYEGLGSREGGGGGGGGTKVMVINNRFSAPWAG